MAYVPYLRLLDYSAVIQKGQLLNQLLDVNNGGGFERTIAESWAMGKFENKVGHNYDLNIEFTPTLPYNPKKKYGAGERCTINFPLWESNKAYVADDCVIYGLFGYICLVDSTATVFDDGAWQQIGNKDDMYHIAYPYPIFNNSIQVQRGEFTAGYYNRGDLVWWNNKIYKALQETSIPSGSNIIQYADYKDLPPVNQFPSSKGSTGFWEYIQDYYIDAGVFPTYGDNDPENVPVWTLGDNRDRVTVQCIVDLAIWQLHLRIAPNNVPQNRIDAMRMTFEFLDNIKNSKQTIALREIQPEDQGQSISFGGSTKKSNGYE